jgi:uncharacterized membrane protein
LAVWPRLRKLDSAGVREQVRAVAQRRFLMEEVLMPFAVFGSAVLMLGLLTRLFSDIALNRTIREAMRAHPDSVPLLAAKLGRREPWADALIGWIFIALAAGIVLMSLFETPGERREMLQGAIVPLIVGIVALAFVGWVKREAEREAGAFPAHGISPTQSAPPMRSARRPRRSPAAPMKSDG